MTVSRLCLSLLAMTISTWPQSNCWENNDLDTRWMLHSLKYTVNAILPLELSVDQLSRVGDKSYYLGKAMEEVVQEVIRNNSGLVGGPCTEDIMYYLKSISRNYKPNGTHQLWPFQMMDAFGKLSPNMMEYRTWEGDMPECILLKAHKQCNGGCRHEVQLHGKYCWTTVALPQYPVNFKVGICIPSTCSSQEINALLQVFNKETQFHQIDIELQEDSCQTQDPRPVDTISVAVMTLYGGLIALVVTGTAYELVTTWRQGGSLASTTVTLAGELDCSRTGLAHKTLQAFSAYRNTQMLFDTRSRKEDTLGCIDGLRAISMVWVIMGHVAIQMFWTEPWKNPMEILDTLQRFWTQCFSNSDFAVDTFICLSGFLVTFVTMKNMKSNNGAFNLGLFYLHRYLRIAPAYALMVAFMTGIFVHTGSGPYWPNTDNYNFDQCRRSWWRNLIYINVYFNDKEACMSQSWYLCLDTFLYTVSPLLLYPMYRKPTIGIVLWTVSFLVSTATPALLIHYHDLASFNTWQMRREQRENYIQEVYYKPWCRMDTFLVGMMFGFISYHRAKGIHQMNKGRTSATVFVSFAWLFVSAMMLAIIYGTYPFSSGHRNMSNIMFTVYGTLTRPAWALGIGWIVFACASGYGGVINTILSAKGFIPISRLSYSYYLVHLTVINHYLASRKTNITQEINHQIYLSAAAFVITSVFAWLLSIAAETPVIQLEKIAMTKVQKSAVAVSTMDGDVENTDIAGTNHKLQSAQGFLHN